MRAMYSTGGCIVTSPKLQLYGFRGGMQPSVSGILRREDAFQFSTEGRQFFSHGLPHDTDIHDIVAMDESVPHPDNLRPGDLWAFPLRRFGHPAGGLANNFNQPDDRQEVQTRAFQVRAALPLHQGNSL